MSRRAQLRSLVEGALAAAPALALLWAVSTADPYVPFPPLALADRIIRITPGSLATWAIDHLHHAAQPLLGGGVTVAFLVVAAVLAVGVRGGGRLGAAGAGVVLAAMSAISAFLSPTPIRAAPTMAASAAAGVVFAATVAWLGAARGRARAAVDPALPLDPGRRRTLLWLASSAIALLGAGTALGRAISGSLGPRTSFRVRAAAAGASRRAPFPHIAALSPEVTSVADHYVVDIDIDDPVIDADGWRLAVGGLVERPLSLGFGELQDRFSLVQQHQVLTCISNRVGGPLVGNSLWEGVRLRELLDAAGARPGAWGVAFKCADGYSAGVPLELARHPTTLVAIAQNGKSLAREHGFPCRIRVPALYGMMNAKWVERIDVVPAPFEGYWAQQGWSPTAVVRTESRIDTPRRAEAGEPTWIAGVAWAGLRGISKVEVSVDGGTSWREARVHEPLSPVAWTQWALRWTPSTPGHYTLACRAADGTGRQQDARHRPPHPSGASGYHEVTVEVA